MSNPYAVIPLTFDATDIQQDPIGIFLEIVRGLNEGPSVRGTDTTVPGLAGRIPRNRVGDTLAIELRGFIAGNGADDAARKADFAALRQAIRTLFDPRAMPASLVASLEDGTTATVAARTLNTVWIQLNPSKATLSVELEAVEDWIITSPPP